MLKAEEDLKKLSKELSVSIDELLDNDVKDVMDECYEKSQEVLEEDDVEAILTYIGLK